MLEFHIHEITMSLSRCLNDIQSNQTYKLIPVHINLIHIITYITTSSSQIYIKITRAEK